MNPQRMVNDWQHLTRRLPQGLQHTIATAINQLQSSNWVHLRSNRPISVQHLYSNKQFLKASGTISLSKAINPTQTDIIDKLINPFCKQEQVLLSIDTNHRIMRITSKMVHKGETVTIVEQYARSIVQDDQWLIIIRTPISERYQSMLPQLESRQKENRFSYQYITVFEQTRDHLLAQSMICLQSAKPDLYKFNVERLLCLSLICELELHDAIPESYTVEKQVENAHLNESNYFSQRSTEYIPWDPPAIQNLLQEQVLSQPLSFDLEYPLIDSFDEQGNATQVDVRDYYVVNFNDTCDFLDRRYNPKYPAFRIENEKQLDRLNDLDEEEKEIMQTMKQKYQSYRFSDNLIIRFLLSRGFDMSAASALLDEQIEWRSTNKINWLTEAKFPEYAQMGIFHIIGWDLLGRNVVYARMCNLYPNKLQNHESFIFYFVSFIERVCRCSLGMADSYLTIVDVDKFGWANFNLDLVKGLMRNLVNNYPERQYKIILVRVTLITRAIFRLIKPFLPQRTLNKLIFVGSKPEEIRQILLKDIDIENIPEIFGGKNPYNLNNF